MATEVKRQGKAKIEPKTLRASVSFPIDLYANLERIAKEKKVSLAWIVRDAAEQYVASRWSVASSSLDPSDMDRK
ncbi:ribbon-helix-helix domain-containing protein [Caballeronia sp. SEWSISQ10-4 2]|uniref:ribbon-helix-helix domain-containing protein n=1 Tax=Caballeronia sp. SEWSISQ10-4 2 TaxID=2937438 RepID=UPI0026530BB2|nr:CopG family transcriptional regulator [Caballeronia sp. SEWSISQ10-4 2]MDN7182063.1 ribbon-helix-helix domain-containing protein [Caballeronia sp. SEWSISQ10-4 2]